MNKDIEVKTIYSGFCPSRKADKYRARIRNKATGAKAIISYYMGIGHNGRKPTQDEVIQGLVSDAVDFIDAGGSVQRFCDMLGYEFNPYNIKSEGFRIYDECEKQLERCKLLGIDAPETMAFYDNQN